MNYGYIYQDRASDVPSMITIYFLYIYRIPYRNNRPSDDRLFRYLAIFSERRYIYTYIYTFTVSQSTHVGVDYCVISPYSLNVGLFNKPTF